MTVSEKVYCPAPLNYRSRVILRETALSILPIVPILPPTPSLFFQKYPVFSEYLPFFSYNTYNAQVSKNPFFGINGTLGRKLPIMGKELEGRK